MSTPPTNNTTNRKHLRIWPALLAAVLIVLGSFVIPVFAPDLFVVGLIGALAGALIVLVWWLFFSRAPWVERIAAPVVMAAPLFATSRVIHPSIVNGMMGMMFPIFSIPIVCLALAVWAVASRRLSRGLRRASQ